MALVALVVRGIGPSPTEAGSMALLAALAAAWSDADVWGVHLPIHRRQVNERWLDHYRAWVYGAGFGWQIGTGLATYITTAAVYLMIVLGSLTGSPIAGPGGGHGIRSPPWPGRAADPQPGPSLRPAGLPPPSDRGSVRWWVGWSSGSSWPRAAASAVWLRAPWAVAARGRRGTGGRAPVRTPTAPGPGSLRDLRGADRVADRAGSSAGCRTAGTDGLVVQGADGRSG